MPGIQIQIDGEHETPTGWLYALSVQWGDGAASDHELTLAWVDHEHLVGGAISPSVVARAGARLAADHFGQSEMPVRCDIANLRRRIDGFDQAIKVSMESGA